MLYLSLKLIDVILLVREVHQSKLANQENLILIMANPYDHSKAVNLHQGI